MKQRIDFHEKTLITTLLAHRGHPHAPISALPDLTTPTDVAVSQDGTLLAVGDCGDFTVKLLDLRQGGGLQVLGRPGKRGGKDGTFEQCSFALPAGLVFSRDARYLFVADQDNHSVRVLDFVSRHCFTLVGLRRTKGSRQGIFDTTELASPRGLALAPDGLFVSCAGQVLHLDLTHKRSRLVSSGAVEGMACIGSQLYMADAQRHLILALDLIIISHQGTGEPGHRDGPASHAQFFSPQKLSHPPGSSLLFISELNNAVRVIQLAASSSPYHQVSTLAGGSGTSLFKFPYGLAASSGTRLFLADCDTRTVKQISLLSSESPLPPVSSPSPATSVASSKIYHSHASSSTNVMPGMHRGDGEREPAASATEADELMEMELKQVNQDSLLTLRRSQNRFQRLTPRTSLERRLATSHNHSFTVSAILPQKPHRLQALAAHNQSLEIQSPPSAPLTPLAHKEEERKKSLASVKACAAKLTPTALSAVSQQPALRPLVKHAVDCAVALSGISKRPGDGVKFLRTQGLALFSDLPTLRLKLPQERAMLMHKLRVFDKNAETVRQHAFLKHFRAWLVEAGQLAQILESKPGELMTPKSGAAFSLRPLSQEDTPIFHQHQPSLSNPPSQISGVPSTDDELQLLRAENERLRAQNARLKFKLEESEVARQDLKKKARSFLRSLRSL